MSSFKLEDLRIKAPQQVRRPKRPKPTTKIPRPQKGERFLMGPIPWSWIAKAGSQSGKSLHVGVVLWHLSQMQKQGTTALRQQILRELGVNRFSAYRALKGLESAGLVHVDRSAGRLARVTLLSCNGKPADDQDEGPS